MRIRSLVPSGDAQLSALGKPRVRRSLRRTYSFANILENGPDGCAHPCAQWTRKADEIEPWQ